MHFDGNGNFSHVLGIDLDTVRGDLKSFDDQFGVVSTKAIELQKRLPLLEDSPCALC